MSNKLPVYALAGAPNSGKTTLFNTLTGSSQKVANYPGVTIERKEGLCVCPSGKKIKIIDLPGLYSLAPQSLDEQIAYDVLHNKDTSTEHPELIIAVIDSSNLERTLGLVLEFKKLNIPMITVLNMIDLAKMRGLKINIQKFETELGVPVVETAATNKKTLVRLFELLQKDYSQTKSNLSTIPMSQTQSSLTDVSERFKEVDRILKASVLQPITHDQLTLKLDKILLHKLWGTIILFTTLLFMFQSVFSWAEWPMTFIEDSIALLGQSIGSLLPSGSLIKSLVVDGIIAGVGSVIVFLPQVLILFFFIFLLESTGYMARAAFLIDKLMALIGLQGRSFVPLLSSFACAIPGVMATRTIRNPKDRLITILIAPLMTCSARLPVYVLLIGAFIPNQTILGLFNLQGLVFFGLFMLGIVTAIIVGFTAKYFIQKNDISTFILELPTYKWPSFKNIFLNLWQRTKIFLQRAGTVIMGVSVGIWLLSTFPTPPQDWQEPAINYSAAGRIGKVIEPIFTPLGFDWRISTGIIPGFAAREVMVGVLGTIFAVDDANEESDSLKEKISTTWPLPTGLALLVWYVYSPQCLATIAVVKKETNSTKWAVIMFSYMITLAYLGALITYQLSSLFFK